MLYDTNKFAMGDLEEAVEGLEGANQEAEQTTDVLQNVDVQTDDEGVPENLPLTGAPVPNTDTVTTPEQYSPPPVEPSDTKGYTTEPGSKGMPTKPPAETFPTPDEPIFPEEYAKYSPPTWTKFPTVDSSGLIDQSAFEEDIYAQRGVDQETRDLWKLDYLPSTNPEGINEFEALDRFTENGGDTNLQNTIEFFNWVRSLPPEQQAIYDRNGDGVFTVADYLNMAAKPTLEEELADTEYWLADLARGGIQARAHSIWMGSTEFLGESNMLEHLITKRRRFFEGSDDNTWEGVREGLLAGVIKYMSQRGRKDQEYRMSGYNSLRPFSLPGMEGYGEPRIYEKDGIKLDASTGSNPYGRDDQDTEYVNTSDDYMFGTAGSRNAIQQSLYTNSKSIANSWGDNMARHAGFWGTAAAEMSINWRALGGAIGHKGLASTWHNPTFGAGGWRAAIGVRGGTLSQKLLKFI